MTNTETTWYPLDERQGPEDLMASSVLHHACDLLGSDTPEVVAWRPVDNETFQFRVADEGRPDRLLTWTVRMDFDADFDGERYVDHSRAESVEVRRGTHDDPRPAFIAWKEKQP